MKLAAVVILYNPKENAVDNIRTYYEWVDLLIVFDNSSGLTNKVREFLKSSPKCAYVSDGINHGIAKALNTAVDMASDFGADWLLTMDQDSYFEKTSIANYIKCMNVIKNEESIGVVGVEYENITNTQDDKCVLENVPHVITSGSFVNIKACKDVGLFDAKLFIDEVDTDFCYRLLLTNYRVLVVRNVSMIHALGENLIVRNWFVGPKVERNIHQPIRIYYIVRNFLYTYFKYKKEFPQEMRMNKRVTINRIKNSFLYSGKSFKVLYYVIKGVNHYYRNKFGKIDN